MNTNIIFDSFFRKYYAPMVSYAALMTQEQDAKDVVQGVFVWFLQHPDKLEEITGPGKDPGPYLMRSVFNACMNSIRGKQSEKSYLGWLRYRTEQEFAVYNPDKNSFIQDLYTREMRRSVEEITEQLPPRSREAFMLAYMEGLPHRRISKIMGVSLSTVENHIYNALKFIRGQIREKNQKKSESV
ncbi:MAG: sigma-70 family RNA polymerase sigma factor [Bacteroidales bacterium]|nr:sigma-70 family RNA polymerase sigma factor [Bacteroidales bacterium]